jgi:uncharacterized BrkB/YihY/UPF0761 family membrane protein
VHKLWQKTKNNAMQSVFKVYRFMRDRRYSTIAGTQVFFLLMSITPFLLWLTVLLGGSGYSMQRVTALAVFNGIRPFVSYLISTAQNAAKGAGWVFLAIALWSSTGFFYHLQRSGEIIYGSNRAKGGIKLRLRSFMLLLVILLFAVVLFALFVVFESLPPVFAKREIADGVLLVLATLCALILCVGLNLFLCPVKVGVKEVLSGSLLTLLWWILFCIGFSIYLLFATPERLYGKIASLFVFLLWCYFMMNGFVVGALYNAYSLSFHS